MADTPTFVREITRIEVSEYSVSVWSTVGYEGRIALTKDGQIRKSFTYDHMQLKNLGWLPRIEAAVREWFEEQGKRRP